ncbi:MAG: hypothetical protein R3E45_07245 [Rhodocyclaceae bacterium]
MPTPRATRALAAREHDQHGGDEPHAQGGASTDRPAITVIVQVARLMDGKRKITSILEITGMEGETITSQEIFGFPPDRAQRGIRRRGLFHSQRCVRPAFQERLRAFGLRSPDEFFDPSRRFA